MMRKSDISTTSAQRPMFVSVCRSPGEVKRRKCEQCFLAMFKDIAKAIHEPQTEISRVLIMKKILKEKSKSKDSHQLDSRSVQSSQTSAEALIRGFGTQVGLKKSRLVILQIIMSRNIET
jgi:hypothetical protein